jgi:multisubunit Na+/H+ antiporter MnhE subunit
MRANSVSFSVISWILFLGIYLLLSGKADVSETVAGAAAATVAILLVALLREKFKLTLMMKPIWFLLLWRIPPAMISESWLLLKALVQRLRGEEPDALLIEYPFPGPDDEHHTARLAFMTFGVCITPNSYLVYYDRKNKRVLVRQLVGKELSTVDRRFVELP